MNLISHWNELVAWINTSIRLLVWGGKSAKLSMKNNRNNRQGKTDISSSLLFPPNIGHYIRHVGLHGIIAAAIMGNWTEYCPNITSIKIHWLTKTYNRHRSSKNKLRPCNTSIQVNMLLSSVSESYNINAFIDSSAEMALMVAVTTELVYILLHLIV